MAKKELPFTVHVREEWGLELGLECKAVLKVQRHTW